MRTPLLSIVVVLFFINACSPSEPGLSEDFRASANELISTFTSYSERNPDIFRPAAYWYRVDDYSQRNYCGYDVIFHELAVSGVSLDESCVQTGVVMKAFSPILTNDPINLSEFTTDDYRKGTSYSVLLLFAFPDEQTAHRFASETYDFVGETYESHYTYLGSLDMPRYVAQEPSMEFVGYARALIPSLEYDGDLSFVHVIIFHKDERVIIHKVYSSDQRIRINY